MTVEEIVSPEERSRTCEAILRALPEWFGTEEAIQKYVREVAELPTFAAKDEDETVGFLSLKRHSPQAAELYVMGVRPERHGQGIGTALVGAAELQLAAEEVELFQVKTLGPSRPSRGYESTRRFYEARGFHALEEISGFWDDNPCLIMVKALRCP